MTEWEVFIVSFCVAFLAGSERLKSLLASLGRLLR
jgi:hypothetical protein